MVKPVLVLSLAITVAALVPHAHHAKRHLHAPPARRQPGTYPSDTLSNVAQGSLNKRDDSSHNKHKNKPDSANTSNSQHKQHKSSSHHGQTHANSKSSGQKETTDTHVDPGKSANVNQSLSSSDACVIDSIGDVSKCQGSKNIAIGNLEVPAGKTLDLQLATGATLTISGEITFGKQNWKGPLMRISGQQVTVQGSGTINGGGEQYWDNKGGRGSSKPDLIHLHKLDHSSVQGLKFLNSPIQCISIIAQDLTISGITIDNALGDKQGAHNTDGIDISDSSGVTIKGSTITTQDDAINILSGNDIHIEYNKITHSHGISIAIVGKESNAKISNVHIIGNQIHDAQNGLRMKTSPHVSGSISDIYYANNDLVGIKESAVVISQNYNGDGFTGPPGSGVEIKGVHLEHTTGSANQALVVLCGNCGDISASQFEVKGGRSIKGIQVKGLSA